METYTGISKTYAKAKLKFKHSIYPNWVFFKFGCVFDPNLDFTPGKIHFEISQRKILGDGRLACYSSSIRDNRRSRNNQRTITPMIQETIPPRSNSHFRRFRHSRFTCFQELIEASPTVRSGQIYLYDNAFSPSNTSSRPWISRVVLKLNNINNTLRDDRPDFLIINHVK